MNSFFCRQELTLRNKHNAQWILAEFVFGACDPHCKISIPGDIIDVIALRHKADPSYLTTYFGNWHEICGKLFAYQMLIRIDYKIDGWKPRSKAIILH